MLYKIITTDNCVAAYHVSTLGIYVWMMTEVDAKAL
jgi:hypothetical protein